MINRRDFLLSSGATVLTLAATGIVEAQTRRRVLTPEDMLPTEVRVKRGFNPGEIHVDPGQFALYWITAPRRAIRYRVGIGRPGLYIPGDFTIRRKAEWPRWTPTAAMIERTPAYARWRDGMPGGPNNPLGARALYLYNARGRDTYLRIHGTNLPQTIGHAVSNGCARLTNEHIVDLYNRVPLGTRAVLYPVRSS
ncbi:MAG: L,D-transpeptidase [Dinoroseobacter sp.]|nr:L,D-transpeptidase [Dinoroseobacter sp.]NQZ71717.1 L,D-transpeptidase [Dinoroseobacter sp.]